MARIEPEDEPDAIDRSEFETWHDLGVSHFNKGEYMEAHEAFERIWLSTQDEESDFYKGLIQGAICLHHFQRGNPEGAKKLYGGQRKLLASYLPIHHGLDLASFLNSMRVLMRPVLRYRDGDPPQFDPTQRPLLERAEQAD